MSQELLSPKEFLEFCLFFIGPFYYYFYTQLNETNGSQKLIATLKKFHFLTFYREKLNTTLNRIDTSLGKPQWSWRFVGENLLFHYGVAIVYVFIVFFIVWFLGGTHTIGALEILPNKESFGERSLVFIALLCIGLLFAYLVSSKFETLDAKFQTLFHSLLPSQLKPHAIWVQKGLIGIITFFTLASFTSFSYALYYSCLY